MCHNRSDKILVARAIDRAPRFAVLRLPHGRPSPADHLLRRIDDLLDIGLVREALADSYSVTGRPSIDPGLMLRMLLVGYLLGIRSERRLCQELHLSPVTGGLH